MSGPMVRAILDGRKTQTRRVVKPQPQGFGSRFEFSGTDDESWPEPFVWMALTPSGKFGLNHPPYYKCPYGAIGDRLWVRETFGYPEQNQENGIVYRASDTSWDDASTKHCKTMLWKPSIFMPRLASRITLEITGVRVERLQDITENDAVSEGLKYEAGVWSIDGKDGNTIARCVDPRHTYEALWESINGKDSWTVNPWVWVVEFKRL